MKLAQHVVSIYPTEIVLPVQGLLIHGRCLSLFKVLMAQRQQLSVPSSSADACAPQDKVPAV